MITNKPPSLLLSIESATTIRHHAETAEQMGQLHPAQLKIIFEQNWFNLFVPRSIGGLELELPEAIRLQESLAWADGSVGWTVTLCSGANWFAGFLHEPVASAIFSNKQVCLAGSGAASGNADITEKGYLVNGCWKYATGAPHATDFTANCVIKKNGETLLEKDGSPVVRAFIFKRAEVEIHNDWNAIGMKATASHSFTVKGLEVEKESSFIIDPDQAALPQPIFNFPFQVFAEVTLAANYSGMAFHFMDLCKVLFEERIKKSGYAIKQACEMLEVLGKANSKLEDSRQFFYDALEKTWQTGKEKKQWSRTHLQTLSEAGRLMVKYSRTGVDELYPFCGMIATDQRSEINRVWRDFHTATQHGVFRFGCG